MADSKKSELGELVSWAYQKATSHPLGQIEQTLNTGKPPAKKPASSPVQDAQQMVAARNQARRDAYDKKYGKPSGHK